MCRRTRKREGAQQNAHFPLCVFGRCSRAYDSGFRLVSGRRRSMDPRNRASAGEKLHLPRTPSGATIEQWSTTEADTHAPLLQGSVAASTSQSDGADAALMYSVAGYGTVVPAPSIIRQVAPGWRMADETLEVCCTPSRLCSCCPGLTYEGSGVLCRLPGISPGDSMHMAKAANETNLFWPAYI